MAWWSRQKWAAGQTVTLYSRPVCALCDEAKDELQRYSRDWGFTLLECDITADWETYEQFHTKIPVIVVAGHVVSIGQVDVVRLSEALQAAG